MKRLFVILLTIFLLCQIAQGGFCGYLKADTQVIVTIGPFVDVSDGFTPQTDIALSGDEAELIKHGSTSVVDISGATWVAVTNCRGYYSLTLTTSHTDTEGQITVIVQDDSDCLPVRNTFMVVNANVYDSLFAAATTDYLQVDTIQVSGDSTAADNLELQYDGTGIIGDNFPFTQSEGAAIGGGLAINTTMASVVVIGGKGSEQDLANASTSDDSWWTGDDDGAGAEFIFRCTPADTDSVPVETMFEGYYDEPSGSSNSATIQVYNFNSAGWDSIVVLTNSGSDEDHEVPLSHAHRAPGGGTLETVVYTIGDVLIKFKQDIQETGNACLLIDHMVVGFVGSLVTATEIVDEWESQSQSDPTGFHVNIKEIGDTPQTANDNGADINTIVTAVGNIETDTAAQDTAGEWDTLMATVDGKLDTAQSDLNTITGASGVLIDTDAVDADAIKADAVTEIWAKAMSDLAAGAPSATASVLTAINYLYEAWRNQTWATSTEIAIYKDDASTPLVESTISDDGTTFKREEMRAPD